MEKNQAIRKWSELYKLDVFLPSEGKSLGKVEDFFFKEGSNAVYALCVSTRLYGELSLPVTGILAVEKDRITVRNAQMLAKAIPPLGRGHQLISRKVVASKDGSDLGTVKDVMLAVEPPVTMRVAGFDVVHGSSIHVLGADGVEHYNDEENSIIVHDQTAKKLR
jgi:uncharacterized protein YrrD